MMVRAIPWGVFNVWIQLIANERWKVLTDEEIITNRILQRNGTHLSMSGDAPFSRGPLATDIGVDGQDIRLRKCSKTLM